MMVARSLRGAASALVACWLLLAVSAFSSAAWAQAGYVHEVSGVVSVQGPGAIAVQAKPGDKFEPYTVFRTGTASRLTLKFADGQVVALSVDSALRVGRYEYVPGSARLGASTTELIKGEMRFVAGLIGAANSETVRIVAGDSVISIQKAGGADFVVAVTPDPQEAGHVVVAQGEIAVRTPYGPVARIGADQYAPWRPGRPPPLPLPLAAAPATVQATTAAMLTTLLPARTPVAVASAAQTVVATAAAGAALAAVAAELQPAGYVASVLNAVTIRTRSGGRTAPAVGTTFEPGATFDTGRDGRVVLKFADGQLVVLGPASTLDVAQYQFDPGNPRAGRAALDLTDGAMRIITGAIHMENREGVSITAGASIVDILNSGPADFTVVVATRNQEVGVARVSVGEISVSTPYGPIDRIKSDQSNLWGPSAASTTPAQRAASLAVVQSAATLQLPGLPDNTPVAVAPAARAAAAVAEANQAQTAATANPQNAQLQASAKAAAALAQLASQEAASANEAVAAKVIVTTLDNLQPTTGSAAKNIATMLQDLPPTAAGPALAQAAVAAPLPVAPTIPTVTPGAGGGCLGSGC